MNNYAVQVYIW